MVEAVRVRDSRLTGRARLDSVDFLRGVIMILMALDHVRDFFGVPGISPTDPARAGAALFFTRWVTHFCAPVFFLLTGTGAYLAQRRRSVRSLSWLLFTRGLWLILLELTVVRCFGFQFNVDYQVTMLVVLWALGWAMIALSALVYLPVFAIAAFAIAMIAGHNLFDGVRSTSAIWEILHRPGIVYNRPPHLVFASYPLVPWIGVTAAGFSLGRIYEWRSDARRTFLLRLGGVLTAAFVVVRGLNVYGDPSPWSAQQTTLQTVLSFLNTTKYPPSLLFLLMTLGPALVMLGAVERSTPAALRPAIIYGRVPMFYFVLHLPLIHLLAVAAADARYGQAHWMFESPDLAHYPFTPPPGWGFSLPIVYAIWAGVVLALYPLCRWFAGVKQRRKSAWLSYL
jgi:uncharacterized membrane protein